MRVSRQLEERERQHDVQLPRERLEARDERVAFERMRAREELLALRLRPVVALEQLRQQDDRGAPRGGVADHRDRLRDVGLERVGHSHLDDAEHRFHDALQSRPAGCCCVTQ